jgi:hypothetical protein
VAARPSPKGAAQAKGTSRKKDELAAAKKMDSELQGELTAP